MIQTKVMLAESLKELLKTKSLEKITVRQLVENCQVNRQTFYYHFHDIYELVEYMFFVELDKIFDEAIDLKTDLFSERWENVYYIILNYMLDNKKIIIGIFHSIGRYELEQILCDVFYYMIMKFIDEESEDFNISQEDKVFMGKFYKYAFAGITLDWVSCCMHEKPKVIVQRVSMLLGGNIKKGLYKSSNSVK